MCGREWARRLVALGAFNGRGGLRGRRGLWWSGCGQLSNQTGCGGRNWKAASMHGQVGRVHSGCSSEAVPPRPVHWGQSTEAGPLGPVQEPFRRPWHLSFTVDAVLPRSASLRTQRQRQAQLARTTAAATAAMPISPITPPTTPTPTATNPPGRCSPPGAHAPHSPAVSCAPHPPRAAPPARPPAHAGRVHARS
eukprot:360622-Chlamydomonas_euryale.AAC.27